MDLMDDSNLISRTENVRWTLQLSLKRMAAALQVPDATYRDWVRGRRKLIPSSLLSGVLRNKLFNPYFTYILTNTTSLCRQRMLMPAIQQNEPQDILFEGALPLPQVILLDDEQWSYEGLRLKLVREYLELSRPQLSSQLPDLPVTTLKNYERLSRNRIPSQLYEQLLTHKQFAPYILFILVGDKARLTKQKRAPSRMQPLPWQPLHLSGMG